jgi:hypothetical protein
VIDLSKIEIHYEPERYPGTDCRTGIMIASGGITVESKCSYDERYGIHGIRGTVERNIKRDIWHEVYGEIEQRLQLLVWETYRDSNSHMIDHAAFDKIRDGISKIFNETKPDLK